MNHDRVVCDQELIRQFINGDHASLEELIKRHQRKVFSYILLIIKDKHLAEDIFQDTFIKVINTLRAGSYNEEGKFLPWVMRIAHNLIIDFFRKSKRMPYVENSEEYDLFETLMVFEDTIEDKLIIEQIHKDVQRLVEYLPEEQKEVLKMRHYKDMSFKEIAEQTNVSINTALGRMRYALINLRKMVNEKEIILTR
ncbi:MAG: sigma-70 family RNA polymerase sigma factor [Bacteroidales bacterium]|jgi:RNA polymerase sigma-70 factor (ECF subfamily)|nr:sigma-70 family RNA polymerase sigma factor [Bacteroidales bacterium]NLM93779.1 sigma-70 family RNA polymerase sigma factor [Bacteroidales bacterium]